MTSDRDKRCVLFTGHRIDSPEREIPRFPATVEPVAQQMINDAVATELQRYPDCDVCGISSGANGGDILFLEACVELGISAEMYIAKPEAAFVEASVADGGPDWVRRFSTLAQELPVHVLVDDSESDLNIWQKTNLWMLETALSISQDRTTVIALWDGESGDGPGGTTDMVLRANAAGTHVVQLDANILLRD